MSHHDTIEIDIQKQRDRAAQCTHIQGVDEATFLNFSRPNKESNYNDTVLIRVLHLSIFHSDSFF